MQVYQAQVAELQRRLHEQEPNQAERQLRESEARRGAAEAEAAEAKAEAAEAKAAEAKAEAAAAAAAAKAEAAKAAAARRTQRRRAVLDTLLPARRPSGPTRGRASPRSTRCSGATSGGWSTSSRTSTCTRAA